ncbi:hypothetical protein GE09DRAFT_1230671 [Coniochaeta sp. 2T2.1]|nr:hypothetical protein GE09DRAFT_1230671 [Coniochaeta sp. 2T2.1]
MSAEKQSAVSSEVEMIDENAQFHISSFQKLADSSHSQRLAPTLQESLTHQSASQRFQYGGELCSNDHDQQPDSISLSQPEISQSFEVPNQQGRQSFSHPLSLGHRQYGRLPQHGNQPYDNHSSQQYGQHLVCGVASCTAYNRIRRLHILTTQVSPQQFLMTCRRQVVSTSAILYQYHVLRLPKVGHDFHKEDEGYFCYYPGCKRKDKPFGLNRNYRKHMSNVHGVKTEWNKTWIPPPARAQNMTNQQPAQATSASLPVMTGAHPVAAHNTPAMTTPTHPVRTGANTTPADVYTSNARPAVQTTQTMQNNQPAGPGHTTVSDPSQLADQLREAQVRESQLLDELRLERARSAADLDAAEARRMADLDAMWRSHQVQLRAPGANGLSEVEKEAYRVERDRLIAAFEEQVQVLHRRHQKSEKKLWGLLNGGK